MRKRLVLFLLTALCALPLSAQSNEIGVWYGFSQIGDTDDEDTTVAFDDGDGLGVSFNRFWTARLSTEVSALQISHDGALELAGASALTSGSLDLTAVNATVQWHFAPRGAFLSPYLGAGVSYVMADDIASDDLRLVGIERVEVDSGVAAAGQAGLDIAFSRRFAVAVDAKYIRYRPDSAETEGGAPLQLDLDPLVFSAGVKLRW